MTLKPRTAGDVFAALGRAICYLFLFLSAQGVIALIYSLTAQMLAWRNPGLLDPEKLVLACSDQISLLSGAAVLVFFLFFFLLRRKNPLKQTGFLRTHGRFVFVALGVTPIVYLAVSLAMSLLPPQWLESYNEAISTFDSTGILAAVATVVMAPLVEEITFRGLILSRLRRALPAWLSVILSALLFAAIHVYPVWMAYAFILGLVFGFLALRARSIWPSLVAHMVFNGIGQSVAILNHYGMDSVFAVYGLAAAGAIICLITLIFILTHPLHRADSDT